MEDETDILSNILEVADSENNIRKNTYFVTQRILDELEISQLEDFAVTCIIVVKNYKDFYEQMVDLYEESSKIKEEGINHYLNLKVVTSNSKDFNNNIKYLFDTKFTLSRLENKIVNVPSFWSAPCQVDNVKKQK